MEEVDGVAVYRSWWRKALSLTVFPGTLAFFIGGAMIAMQHGLPPALVSPVAVPFFTVYIAILERVHPYRREWNVVKSDLIPDLGHLVSSSATTQLVIWGLNFCLVPAAALLSARFTWFAWPTHWPLLLQLVLALVVSEFGGYWAHRLQHEIPLLWRVHAVHHAAPRLYWLNAARFHPIDMAMLSLGGFTPLILFGCPPDAMALALLFAGLHGTFQHANIHMNCGVLNWVLSTAQLHRWHHSTLLAEGNTNYSGHILIWDIVFGTRALPRDREPPAEIGIAGIPNFPVGYLDHLKSPFIFDQIRANATTEKDAAPTRPISSHPPARSEAL